MIQELRLDMDQSMLTELFGAYGEVSSAHVVSDRETGRSRGFGFVEMPNKKEALDAINNLAQSNVNGRNIVVNEARPKAAR
jgi:RNA recognition motif-containing protein